MTTMLFREDPYLREAEARVTGHTDEGGIVLDQSLFYPTGGGQPGDSGTLHWQGNRMDIATSVKGQGDDIVLVPAEPVALPPVGTWVTQSLNWERRLGHMRVHTALHLLSVVLPYGVTGGSIGAFKGRLDFDMEEAPDDKEAIEVTLNAFVEQDFVVRDMWIDEAELDANPDLVKTIGVRPPRGSGRIRMVQIGDGNNQIDLQPCGGTHVARTGEIGRLRLGRIENKGRNNRRINLHLDS